MAARIGFRAILLAAALIGSTHAQADPRCPAGASAVRILPLEPAQIAVPVHINGIGPFKFLLDTGSQLTVLEPSLAEQLELQTVGSIGIVSVAADSTAALVGVERIRVGTNETRGTQVAVLDLTAIQSLNPEVRGVLGQDFLAQFDLLIDQPHMLLCFDQTGHMQRALDGEHIPVLRSSTTPSTESFTEPVLIAAHLESSGLESIGPEGNGFVSAILKLDCGGNVPLLFQSPPLLQSKQRSRGSDKTREGSALGRRTSLLFRAMSPRNVIIGTRHLHRITFLTLASSAGTAPRSGEDGLLPTTLFKRVFISNRDRFVIFDPR